MMKVAVKSSPNLDRFTEEEEFIFPSVINQNRKTSTNVSPMCDVNGAKSGRKQTVLMVIIMIS